MLKPLQKFGGIVALLMLLCVVYAYKVTKNPISASNSVDPFVAGIYTTGILESNQTNGSNVNIYPEVASRVVAVLVKDGQMVKAGEPMLELDAAQQRELVARDEAQIAYELANLQNVTQQYTKLKRSQDILFASVSRNAVDNSHHAVKMAEQSVNVARAAYQSDKALLDKYVVKAPITGRVMRVLPAVGDYVSPQGAYDTYSQTYLPAILMETDSDYLQVRCFLDEILVPSLPDVHKVSATLFVRGRKTEGIPLEFVNLQPFTIPNTQLSNERAERVDVRVLPIIFKFKKPEDMTMFPGQLVDIYLKG